MRVGAVLRQVPLALRLALREMRGGLKGFYIFLACITLGTAAIAGVNSVSSAITQAIASQGQTLLAGDVRFEFRNRFATPEELNYFEGLGAVSRTTGLRSMVRLPDGSDQTLVEAKGVDGAYPLYGTLETEPQKPAAALFAKEGDAYGAVVAPLLLDRLGLAVGDEILLGTAKIRIAATLTREPDAVSEGFGFAPRLMLSEEALQRKFGRELQRDGLSWGFDADFQVESYLRHQGTSFVDRFDANAYLYITRALDYFDLAAQHGGVLAQAFARARAVRFCVLSFSSDWLYSTAESRDIVRALNAAGCRASFVEIETDKGHDAFLVDEPEFLKTTRGFLESAAIVRGLAPKPRQVKAVA